MMLLRRRRRWTAVRVCKHLLLMLLLLRVIGRLVIVGLADRRSRSMLVRVRLLMVMRRRRGRRRRVVQLVRVRMGWVTVRSGLLGLHEMVMVVVRVGGHGRCLHRTWRRLSFKRTTLLLAT